MRKLILPVLALFFAASLVVAHATHVSADPRDFQVTNNNPSLSVTQLFVDVSGPGDFDPSSELLQGDTLAPGQGGTVMFDPTQDADQCTYDIQAVYSDGSTREFDGLNLCQTSSISIS